MAQKEQMQLELLQAAEGDAFDQAFVAAQTTAHDEAVALFDTISTQGQESALRGFAAETPPTLQEHQAMVGKLGETN
jgi:putative membrane protein